MLQDRIALELRVMYRMAPAERRHLVNLLTRSHLVHAWLSSVTGCNAHRMRRVSTVSSDAPRISIRRFGALIALIAASSSRRRVRFSKAIRESNSRGKRIAERRTTVINSIHQKRTSDVLLRGSVWARHRWSDALAHSLASRPRSSRRRHIWY